MQIIIHWYQSRMVESVPQPTAQNDAWVAACEFGKVIRAGEGSEGTCRLAQRGSRTPNPRGKRRGGRGTQALPAFAQLALPAPSGGSQLKARGHGKKGGGKSGRTGGSYKAPSTGDVWNYYDLLRGGSRVVRREECELKKREASSHIAHDFTFASAQSHITIATAFSRRSMSFQVDPPELKIQLLRAPVLLPQPSSVHQQ